MRVYVTVHTIAVLSRYLDTMAKSRTELTDERRLQGRRLEAMVRHRWKDPRGIRGLSHELGVSRATVYSWFNGATSPDTASLTRLARLLAVSPSELLVDLQGGDQAAVLEDRIRAVVNETVEDRMLARAADSWREPPPLPAVMAQTRYMSVPAPRSTGRAIPSPRRRSARMLDVLGPQTVEWCNADDPVGPVARRLYAGNYSQMPVRDRDTWVGLLTTDTIARWTAARTERDLSYDESTLVREVLPYAEDPDNFRVVSEQTTVAEVSHLFEGIAAHGRVLVAVLVTPTVGPQDLMGIVTAFDLSRLT